MKGIPAILRRPMRRLHLHPQQPPPVIHNQVVPRTLPPRLRHPEPQCRRLRQKRRLRHLPALLPRQLQLGFFCHFERSRGICFSPPPIPPSPAALIPSRTDSTPIRHHFSPIPTTEDSLP